MARKGGNLLDLLQAIKKEKTNETSPSASTTSESDLMRRMKIKDDQEQQSENQNVDRSDTPSSTLSLRPGSGRDMGRFLNLLKETKNLSRAGTGSPADTGYSSPDNISFSVKSYKNEDKDLDTISRPSTSTFQNISPQAKPYQTPKETVLPKENTTLQPVRRLGTQGHKVTVSANYLRLSVKPRCYAYEYHVGFNPEIEHKGFRISMLKEHSKELGNDLVFDGSILFLPQILPEKTTIYLSRRPSDKIEVAITITFVKERNLSEMKHLFNILFKKIMSVLKYVKIGADVFDHTASISIPQYKLQLWPGYVIRVNEYEDGLMLVLDPTHKTLREDTVLDEILILTRNNGNEDTVKTELLGRSVLTKYSCKLYTIHDIDFHQTPMSKFQGKNNEQMTYVEYYKKAYNIDIENIHQPLIISKNTVRKAQPTLEAPVEDQMICLIPELCNMTGITDKMRNNFELMKHLASSSNVTPNQRYQALKTFIDKVNNDPNASKILNDWGLRLDNTPVNFDARYLPPEQIKFKDHVTQGTCNWNKESTMYPVITPIDLIDWIILYTPRDKRCVENFRNCIMRLASTTGIKVSDPKLIMLQSDRIDQYINTIRRETHSNLQMVVCVCPTNRDDRYAAIKKVCCVENPIPSQVVNAITISKPDKLRAIAHKILLQINCKVGGSLWSISIPYRKPLVIGIDVYHSKANSTQSVLAFVASYNNLLTKWYSRVCFQRNQQEIGDKMKTYFLDSLRLYKKTNGDLPERIIIYRDGVGDGQLKYVHEYEIAQLESCLTDIDNNYSPAFVFIIVQKRNNVRIFENESRSTNVVNPKVGLVVDNSITRKYLYDFYLVSHQARHSSLRPTHYIVLKDTANTDPDHIQKFTFKMCHLYYNWPGSIRVPTPCQYAHKLAYLIGGSVRKEHDHSLATTLFFL